MRFQAVAALMLLSITSVLSQPLSLTLEVDTEKKVEDAIKEAVVGLVKKEASLSLKYGQLMDEAFSFLDPEDPRRIDASELSNLGDYSLSSWIPSHSFRYGQGDYTYCDINTEIATSENGTVLVGFDTSYKREVTYDFWAVYSYFYFTCESDSDESVVTKAKIRVDHVKWLSEEVVSELLY